jgi:hypothetical protein
MNEKKTLINLTTLNLEELHIIVENANVIISVKELELKKDREIHSKTSLIVGDVVELFTKKFRGELWEVLKLNPKYVKCLRENGEKWNIPYSNILIS